MSAAIDFESVYETWLGDSVQFVRDNFGAEPDAWQREVLEKLPSNPRVAMSACKGPGKSTTLAWCGWWILGCHEDAQGAALSITADNLKDNLWKELAVWYDKSEFLKALFVVRKKRIESRERPDTWFLSARSFAQGADDTEQANSLAGLHSPVVFILLDEVGEMSPGVIGAAKGIFYTAGQRAWVLVAGNPTTMDGALYWVTTTDSAQWDIVYITGDPDSPKRSPRIDIDQARADIAAMGRDNPWVMVNILGQFPPQGANKLIDANNVLAAMSCDIPAMTKLSDAIVWGLDPARSEKSSADEACLMRRQGPLARRAITWRGMDGTELGDAVAKLLQDAEKEGELPDAVFVDVGGIGASPYDRLKVLGYGKLVHPVDFGGSPADGGRFHDKRTEMWDEMAEWTKNTSSCLPNDPKLRGELVEPRYYFRRIQKRTKYILESKDDLKSRGVPSPNRADALALTFAAPVAPRTHLARVGRQRKARADFNIRERL